MHLTHPARETDVSPQAEEYLEAVCRILERGEIATPTELARELSVAPPSVLGMLRRLEEQGLVQYARYTGAVLTSRGDACAETLRRRHRLAERLLTDLLGIPWARAHDIACRFEHVIDDEVEGYLQAALHHPTTCPHGNPLDQQVLPSWQPLAALVPGQSACLQCIVNETLPMLDYLAALNLRPGTVLTLCAVAPFDGPLTVEIDGQRHAISRDMATHLLVERMSA